MNHYKVCVVGYIWWPNGMEYANEYKFCAENDDVAIDIIDEVTGDFCEVRDFALYRRENCLTCGHVVWECIREFSKEGAATYSECMT